MAAIPDPVQTEKALARCRNRHGRAKRWRKICARLRADLAAAGVSQDAIDKQIATFRQAVADAHERSKIESRQAKRARSYAIHFETPPEVGTEIDYRGQVATVVRIEPYTRKDGEPSQIIRWQMEDGRTATSALIATSVSWSRDA